MVLFEAKGGEEVDDEEAEAVGAAVTALLSEAPEPFAVVVSELDEEEEEFDEEEELELDGWGAPSSQKQSILDRLDRVDGQSVWTEWTDRVHGRSG